MRREIFTFGLVFRRKKNEQRNDRSCAATKTRKAQCCQVCFTLLLSFSLSLSWAIFLYLSHGLFYLYSLYSSVHACKHVHRASSVSRHIAIYSFFGHCSFSLCVCVCDCIHIPCTTTVSYFTNVIYEEQIYIHPSRQIVHDTRVNAYYVSVNLLFSRGRCARGRQGNRVKNLFSLLLFFCPSFLLTKKISAKIKREVLDFTTFFLNLLARGQIYWCNEVFLTALALLSVKIHF